MGSKIKYNVNQAPKTTISTRNKVVYDSQMEAHVANALWYTTDGTHDEVAAHKFVILDPINASKTRGQYTTDFSYTDPRTGKMVVIEVKGSKSFKNWPTVKKLFSHNVSTDGLFSTFVCVFRNEVLVGDRYHNLFPEDLTQAEKEKKAHRLVRRGALYKCSCGHSYFAPMEAHKCPWCDGPGEFVSENPEQVGKDLFSQLCQNNEQAKLSKWEETELEEFKKECDRLGLDIDDNTGEYGDACWRVQDLMIPRGVHEPPFIYTEKIEGTEVYGHAAKYTTFVEVLEDKEGWRGDIAKAERELVDDGFISRLVIISKRGLWIYEEGRWDRGGFFQCPTNPKHVFLSQLSDGKCPCCDGGGSVQGSQLVSRYTPGRGGKK